MGPGGRDSNSGLPSRSRPVPWVPAARTAHSSSVIDISSAGLQFRGAPVTLISEGVEALLRRYDLSVETAVGLILRTAEDIESCIVLSFAVGDVAVWAERFGCTFEDGRHEGGEWSMFLPRER